MVENQLHEIEILAHGRMLMTLAGALQEY
jgi:hypothetical protein